MGFLTPHATGELSVLITYVDQQLSQLRSSVYGLTDAQIHLRPSASDLTLAMLIRHCALVAAEWSDACATAPECPSARREFEDESFDVTAQRNDTVEELLAHFDRCRVFALERLHTITDLTTQVPVPEAPWFPPELKSWEVRWVLLHIVAELARHAGHADIIRESIDGKGSYELNDRADGVIADDETWPSEAFASA